MGEHHDKAPRHPEQAGYQEAAQLADQSATNLIAALVERGDDPGAITAGLVMALCRHVCSTLVAPVTGRRIYGALIVAIAPAANQVALAAKAVPPTTPTKLN